LLFSVSRSLAPLPLQSFPTRRSSDLVTVAHGLAAVFTTPDVWWGIAVVLTALTAISIGGPWLDGIVRSRPSAAGPPARVVLIALDRKSTRLNSSHVKISYAVFCLKKK